MLVLVFDLLLIGKYETGQSSETGRNLEGIQSNPKEEQPKSSLGIKLIFDLSL